MAAFARKLARFNNIDLPLTRNPRDVFSKIDALMPGYLDSNKDFITSLEAAPEFETAKKRTLDFDIVAEVQWLKDVMPTIKRRRALAHGDMNRANCLVREDREDPYDKIMLIDYEFASYGYRGLDIGMQFSNRTMDVSQIHNKFKSGLDFPTIEERLHFIRAYKDEVREMNAYELDESENGLDSDTNMLIEADYYVLAFSMFFMLMIVGDYQKFMSSGWEKLFNIFVSSL